MNSKWWVLIWLLSAACLTSCATTPRPHAETFVMKDYVFSGPRVIFLSDWADDRQDILERLLRERGFRVSRGIPGVKVQVPARYVLSVAGRCPEFWAQTYADLRADVFDNSDGSERVFSAHLNNTDDCPERFFAEIVESISRNWEKPQAPVPTDRL